MLKKLNLLTSFGKREGRRVPHNCVYSLGPPCKYLNTALVVRATWPARNVSHKVTRFNEFSIAYYGISVSYSMKYNSIAAEPCNCSHSTSSDDPLATCYCHFIHRFDAGIISGRRCLLRTTTWHCLALDCLVKLWAFRYPLATCRLAATETPRERPLTVVGCWRRRRFQREWREFKAPRNLRRCVWRHILTANGCRFDSSLKRNDQFEVGFFQIVGWHIPQRTRRVNRVDDGFWPWKHCKSGIQLNVNANWKIASRRCLWIICGKVMTFCL